MDWLEQSLSEFGRTYELPSELVSEKCDTGYNKGQKCDWVGEANKKRVWSEATREKHRRSQAKRGAKIYCSDLNKTWDCAKDAGEELGMNPKLIYRVACGERKTHKGLHFERIGIVETRNK